jgi:N6-L-threonylcarbamoyladenine synthase
MVYVLSNKGTPLMPTKNHAKVRVLLQTGRAEVTQRCPFTIRLLYGTTDYTQPVSLGIDAGSKHIGVSATTGNRVLYEADVELRNDIVQLLSARREARRAVTLPIT